MCNLYMGYLLESDITSGAIDLTWSFAPRSPFGEWKVYVRTFANVDQVTPITDSAVNSASAA